MPDLLIELFSEEIPARMQAGARDTLKKLVTDGLVEAGLTYGHAAAFSTPRRLVLAVEGLTSESPTQRLSCRANGGFLCVFIKSAVPFVIACCSVLMAPLGARAAHALPVSKLKRAFAMVLIALALYMLDKGIGALGG